MDIRGFVAKWRNCVGGAERSNAALYLVEMLAALDLPTPDPAGAATRENDYVFERGVRPAMDGAGPPRRIDLYKRGCFILEAKQTRLTGRGKGAAFAQTPPTDTDNWKGWDTALRHARAQARGYVGDLPSDHVTPPFILICDVARGFEVWADFTGTGRDYSHFPDRKSFRFSHEQLLDPAVQTRLRAIWTDPASLDPSRHAALITREIVDELAVVSRRLERKGNEPQRVAEFLMRCIFTIFAADVGLLPKAALRTMIEDGVRSPKAFGSMLGELWRKLDEPDRRRRFFAGFGDIVPYINGNLFCDHFVPPMEADDLNRLLLAARRDWRQVEPAIFGALLEHALQTAERRKLGAHYTPRRYVERLVDLTVMEPLRQDWRNVVTRIEQARDEGDAAAAIRLGRRFHDNLCRVRVLDPACGTGNFLYVCMDMMKRLEAEVLETLAELGDTERLDLATIEPGQFLGLELNPRAAAIAELVLWIGFLQQHYRQHASHPAEPILRAHGNIERRDAVLDWKGAPEVVTKGQEGAAVKSWPNALPPAWPEADFIVGNPPFVGGKDLRGRLDPGYAEALWRAHPQMNPAADLVMYWWDRAAHILTRPGTRLRRFGFVTTNSITQVFQRKTVERWLGAPRPLSLIYAIPDHPWTKAARDSAAVRIAMTVAETGVYDGERLSVIAEAELDTDAPIVALSGARGRINADLSLGVDVTRAKPLRANAGVCSPGVKLHGSGFIVSRAQAAALGLGMRAGLDAHIRPYRNGRDLTGRPRDALVIDLFGLSREAVRERFPEVYGHLVAQVKERRDERGRLVGRDANPRAAYRDAWWIFGEPRGDFRPALANLPRYIATVETAKHRVFQFLEAEVLPDNMLVCVASSDAADLAVLSSRAHRDWCRARGGSLEDRPRYTKTACFDAFPFPDLTTVARARLVALGDSLDRQRKAVLRDNPGLTLTGLYNLIEAAEAGRPLSPREEDQARRGCVAALRDWHADIDAAVAEAYGWPVDQPAEQTVAALLDLNRRRAAEEAEGQVHWLRPDLNRQPSAAARSVEPETTVLPFPTRGPRRRLRFPADRYEQPLALQAALARASTPLAPADLARGFSGGERLTPRIDRVLATLHRYGHVERLDDGRWVSARA